MTNNDKVAKVRWNTSRTIDGSSALIYPSDYGYAQWIQHVEVD